jgi:hypothetical protein
MHEELFKAGWSGPEANNLAMREWVFLPDIGDESENEQSAGEVDDGLA